MTGAREEHRDVRPQGLRRRFRRGTQNFLGRGLAPDGDDDLADQRLTGLVEAQRRIAFMLAGDVAGDAARPDPLAAVIVNRHRGDGEEHAGAVSRANPDPGPALRLPGGEDIVAFRIGEAENGR